VDVCGGGAHAAGYGAHGVYSLSGAARPSVAESDRGRVHDHGVAILVVDYASQLTFIQAALVLGETEGLSPWTQYNPHGIFIALENVGYMMINIAFLFIGISMLRMPRRLWRVAGWIFTVGGVATLALLVFYSAFYQVRLDYRFEVLAIFVTWLVLIATPVLLTIALLRTEPGTQQRAKRLEMSRP
jgi:hypothetical protein